MNAFEATFRVCRYDHKYCWLEGKALPVLDGHGVVTAWSGWSRELSFFVPMEKSGGSNNALYRAIAAKFPMGAVFVLDTNFRYQLVDGPGLQDAGMVPSDFEGKTLWEVLPPDLAAQH